MATFHADLDIRFEVIAGGAAGDHTVTGITTNDVLKAVIEHTGTGGAANLTSEFSITAADTINNTGGTATTGDFLQVVWIAADARGASLTR